MPRKKPLSNVGYFATNEFRALRKMVPDAEILFFEKEILALADKFGKSGQSGGSAPAAIQQICVAINTVLSYRPLVPVMGSDDEWADVSANLPDGSPAKKVLQNVRCPNMFINDDAPANFLDAIVWREGEQGFTGFVEGISSVQFVKGFPFVPRTFYVDVEKVFAVEKVTEEEEKDYYKDDDGNYYTYVIVNPEQLNPVLEYYQPFNYAHQEIQVHVSETEKESSQLQENDNSGEEDDQG